MKRFTACMLALVLFTGAGCIQQDTNLVHLQTEEDLMTASSASASAEPTAEPTPSPEPIVLNVPEIKGNAFTADALGIPIVDPTTHYATYYVRFSQIRVYEVGDSTFVDAQCENLFSEPLTGKARIVFYGQDGKEYGFGEWATGSGELTLGVGLNYIYAEVLTEVDVQSMNFDMLITAPFAPESGA